MRLSERPGNPGKASEMADKRQFGSFCANLIGKLSVAMWAYGISLSLEML